MFFILLLANACRKEEDPCHTQQAVIDFSIYEEVGDTLLVTDTVFERSEVWFKTNHAYNNIQWKIGNDSRVFTSSTINLYFNFAETIPVHLNASINNNCQQETRSVDKPLVIVPNDGSHISPITGIFTGYNTDNTNDPFTVTVKFWYGARYNWWKTGAYTIHNMPRGYSDSTQNFNGFSRPEINGILCANGYKHLVFDKSGSVPAQGIKAYCSLRQGKTDSLIIDYTILDLPKFNQTGQISYISKKFVGIRQ